MTADLPRHDPAAEPPGVPTADPAAVPAVESAAAPTADPAALPGTPPDELDALSTEQLRHRAFALARHRHDAGFFWDLVKHLPESADFALGDGSSGALVAQLTDLVTGAEELLGGRLTEDSDLARMYRVRFLEYLRTHG